MANLLMLLKPEGRDYLTRDQFLAGIPASIEELSVPFGRRIDLVPLQDIVAEAMKRFEKAQESDAWLAPRVHATLRLYRREAADRLLWYYLSVKFRDYTLWRWKKEDGTIPEERIIGGTNRHALARLWWLAELARNGPDYRPAVEAFRLQEIVQWILDVEAFQNRPAALGYIRFLGAESDGIQARKVAKRLNHALTTIVLDALVPDVGPDMDSVKEWIGEAPDQTKMIATLPEGPGEDRVADADINAVEDLLGRIQPKPLPVRAPGSRDGRRAGPRQQSGESPAELAAAESVTTA